MPVSSKPAARTCRTSVSACRHFSWKRTPAGIRACCRRSGVSHSSGRYNIAPTHQARRPVQSAAVVATWQLAILPNAPQYCRIVADRVGPLLRETRAIEDQDAATLGNDRPQPPPHPLGAPRARG